MTSIYNSLRSLRIDYHKTSGINRDCATSSFLEKWGRDKVVNDDEFINDRSTSSGTIRDKQTA